MEFDNNDGDEEMDQQQTPRSSYDSEATAAATAGVHGSRKTSSSSSTGAGATRYRECQKNHAVGIGGHAVDGCGEFLPAGEVGSLEALRCAACGCHRNFHRKEHDGVATAFHHPQFSPYYRTPASYLHHHIPAIRAAPPFALTSTSGGRGGGQSRVEELQDEVMNPVIVGSGGGGGGGLMGRKRFRTKFTQEQKEKMLELAERVEWRIQKNEEGLVVEEVCNEIGVSRNAFKVWMHNNKHILGKKATTSSTDSTVRLDSGVNRFEFQ